MNKYYYYYYYDEISKIAAKYDYILYSNSLFQEFKTNKLILFLKSDYIKLMADRYEERSKEYHVSENKYFPHQSGYYFTKNITYIAKFLFV